MKKRYCFFYILWMGLHCAGQVPYNVSISQATAEAVLSGSYDANTFATGQDPGSIQQFSSYVSSTTSADSLRSFTERMISFHNRHTHSDTVSSTTGIGAARRWLYEKLGSLPAAAEGRLLRSYMDFQIDINGSCGPGEFRNIMAVLPGTKGPEAELVLLVAHYDTRCEERCDTECLAQGADDNTSGSALLLEACRILSILSYEHTIVFLWTVGEEQGLYGATAFAEYASLHQWPIRAVLNNDIVGGIRCGQTSSPPSCSPAGGEDSTHLRIFSFGSDMSIHKNLSRFVVQTYDEHLLPCAPIAMGINIQALEDREGRGGDHIPFRQRGYPALRFTSSFEHGNGNPTGDYTDHQHTSEDVLGIDTDGDEIPDSLFIHFPYLARNTQINALAAGALAMAPPAPQISIFSQQNDHYIVLETSVPVLDYRYAIRMPDSLRWSNLYTTSGNFLFAMPGLMAGQSYLINGGFTDIKGYPSLLSNDILFMPPYSSSSALVPEFAGNEPYCENEATGLINQATYPLIILPNPADEEIYFYCKSADTEVSYIAIYNCNGERVAHLPADGLGMPGRINTSAWPDGIYYVILQDKQGIYSGRATRLLILH